MPVPAAGRRVPRGAPGRRLREVDLEDVSADWTAFTADRLARFRERRARHVAVYGADVAAGLDDFFATIAGLYADGVLGGVRILATR